MTTHRGANPNCAISCTLLLSPRPSSDSRKTLNPLDGSLDALAATLRERRRLVGDRAHYANDPAGHLAQLQRVSEEISEKASALHLPAPQLAHYLQRCSYDKALAWIESASSGA